MRIDLEENTSLDVLQKLSFWREGEIILSSVPAGEGNMNLVLRVKTNLRSVILKQSKSYVQKYRQIDAPIKRIEIEKAYYATIESDLILRSFSPNVLAFFSENHLLILEDLGLGADFSFLYNGNNNLESNILKGLSDYLNALHGLEVKDFPANSAMKSLNHEHIFNFPFALENGFDLDSVQPGLQDLSMNFKRDKELKAALTNLGDRYMSTGNTLLHGDFYPGSWLKLDGSLKIIDPEFGFMGDKEFDLGVLCAHFDLAQQPECLRNEFLKAYHHPYATDLLNQFQGAEILRRLIGIAQLPVTLTLAQKNSLLERGRNLVLGK